MFGQRIVDARAAVERFLFTLLNPADEFFVTAFNHAPRPLTPWTATPSVVSDALERVCARPAGRRSTTPWSARCRRSIAATGSARRWSSSPMAPTRPATRTLRDVRAALLRSDAFVYAIAIDSPGGYPDQRAGQPCGAQRDHRPERRPDGSRARRGRPARRDGAHRRRAEQPVRARLFLAEEHRRQVPQHPRVDARPGHARPGPERLRRQPVSKPR